MTETDLTKGTRPTWGCYTALYDFLAEIFPDYRSPRNALDVNRIGQDTGLSHEAVYKWLRVNKLNPRNAKKLCDLANHPDNVASLARLKKQPPTIQDFNRFVYA